MSRWFGIQPWDYERLTFGELRVYIDALARIAKEHAQAQAQARNPLRR